MTKLSLSGARLEREDDKRYFKLSVEQFDAREGDRVALVGPSGCGKTTMLEILAGARRPAGLDRYIISNAADSLDCNVLELWTNNLSDELSRVRANYFGYVQQTGGLLNFLTVRQNIILALKLALKEDGPDVTALCERLGIENFLDAMPQALSVGQRQRVVIARSLVHKPLIVLADEPTASVDLGNTTKIMELLTGLTSESGAVLILATHDLKLAEEFEFDIVKGQTDLVGSSQTTSFSRIVN